MPSDKTRLNDLMSRWERMKEQGESVAIEDLCRDTPDLLAEARRHIAALEALNSVMAQTTGMDEVPVPAQAPRIPGYEIIEELGRGGMGVVYKARQPGLKRIVALKMIRKGAEANAEDLDRFRAEAEAVAGLQHANIVQIYEIGAADGQPFFALEYVAGGSLADQLDATPQPPKHAARLVALLARAVEAAHEIGIVHRDLKPGNILLKRGKPSDTSLKTAIPKITDFGLAKRLDDDSSQTRTGAILGTPSYMSPEQASGQKKIGPGADIYSLGVILYEMLTGRPPFKGTTVLDTLEQVRSAEPVSPRQWLPKVPLDLETICLKCLSKDPSKRYATAALLAEDLDRFRRGEPITARRTGWIERSTRWCRRKPALASLMLLAAFTIAASVAGAVGFGFFQAGVAEDSKNKQKELAAAADNLEKEQGKLKDALAQSQKNFTDLQETEKRRQEFAGTSAHLFLERGVALCDKEGDAAGLLFMTRALQLAPDDAELQRSIRLQLGVWSRWIHPLEAQLPHEGAVNAVTFRPDGKVFLTNDGAVHLWNADTLDRIGQPLRHGDQNEPSASKKTVLAAAFTPDNKQVLTAGRDNELRFWDAATGAALGESVSLPRSTESIAIRPDGVIFMTLGHGIQFWDMASRKSIGAPMPVKGYLGASAAAFTADGKYVVAVCGDSVGVWDAYTYEPVALPNHKIATKTDLSRIALSPDGKTLLVGGAGGGSSMFSPSKAYLIDLATGKTFGASIDHTNLIPAVAFNPHGKSVVTGSYDRTARLCDALTGKPFGGVMNHAGQVLTLTFSPDGKYLLTACSGGAARVWDASTGSPMGPPLAHRGDVTSLAFDPDGKSFLTGSADHTVRRWRLAEVCYPPEPKFHFAGRAYFSPDGARVVLRDAAKNLRLWDVMSGKPISDLLPASYLTPSSTGPLDPVFSADGKVMAYGLNDKVRTIRTWDTATGKPFGPPMVPEQSTDRIILGPKGRHMLTLADADGATWDVWDTIEGKRVFVLTGERAHPRGPEFSPDGETVLTFTDRFRFWNAFTGKPRWPDVELPQPENANPLGKWNPNGKVVLLANNRQSEKHIFLWNPATGMRLGEPLPLGPAGGIDFVRFSHDGQILVTKRIYGRKANLWNATTGRPIGKPIEHLIDITALVFNPTASILASASDDRTVRLWDTTNGMPTSPPLSHFGTPRPAFSKDGRILLTNASEISRLWESPSGRPLGPKLPVWAGPSLPFFHPDGKSIIVASTRSFDGPTRTWSDAPAIRIWPVPTPLPGEINELARWVEGLTGQELTQHGRTRVLDANAWQERRDPLKKANGR